MCGGNDRARAYALDLTEGSVVVSLEEPHISVTLGRLLGSGSVGRVYELRDDPWTCAKIFNSPGHALGSKVTELAEKYARGELAPKTASWPRTLLADPSGEVVGYLMDRVEGPTLSELACRTDLGLAERGRIASAWARRLAECHGRRGDPPERSIVVGDVSLANAVYDETTGEPRLVDVDGFQVAAVHETSRLLFPVRELHSHSPESIAGEAGRMALSARHDAFLCAEGCFQLLMGCDPLMGDEEEGDRDAVRAQAVAERRYPYLEAANEGRAPSPMRVVGEELDALFAWSFCGKVTDIPSCSQYAAAIARLAESAIERCPECGEDHVGLGLDCPYCTLDEGVGVYEPPTRLAPAPASSSGANVPDVAAKDTSTKDTGKKTNDGSISRTLLVSALLIGLLVIICSLVSQVNAGLAALVYVGGSALVSRAVIKAIGGGDND